MNVAIVGSRQYPALDAVHKFVYHLAQKHPDAVVVSGGARGVDSTAEDAAKNNGLKTLIFKPDWDRYGKSAGFLRNQQIIDAADVIVAFWDGASRGTQHDIHLALAAKKELFVYGADGQRDIEYETAAYYHFDA